jgi:hypothetical protein
MRPGSIIIFAAAIIAVIWIFFVTLVYWDLDPKFGGPYRWATFQMREYWLVSLFPSTILFADAARD